MMAKGKKNSYDFSASSDKMLAFADQMNSYKESLVSCRKNIFSTLRDLENDWSGNSYDTFYENCKKYRSSMKVMEQIIDAYASLFSEKGEIYKAYETLETSRYLAMMSLTDRGRP